MMFYLESCQLIFCSFLLHSIGAHSKLSRSSERAMTSSTNHKSLRFYSRSPRFSNQHVPSASPRESQNFAVRHDSSRSHRFVNQNESPNFSSRSQKFVNEYKTWTFDSLELSHLSPPKETPHPNFIMIIKMYL